MQTPRIVLLTLALGALIPAAFAQNPGVPAQQVPAGALAGHEANRVTGAVTAATNGSYTVTPRRNGSPVTFALAANASVVQGAPGTISDVQAGSPVRVEGTVSADGTSISATRITVLAALPTRGRNWGRVQPNGKHVTGTVASLSPFKVTAGDGTTVSVDTTASPRVMVETATTPDAIAIGSHVQVTLDRQGAAREVVILPARRGRGNDGI